MINLDHQSKAKNGQLKNVTVFKKNNTSSVRSVKGNKI